VLYEDRFNQQQSNFGCCGYCNLSWLWVSELEPPSMLHQVDIFRRSPLFGHTTSPIPDSLLLTNCYVIKTLNHMRVYHVPNCLYCVTCVYADILNEIQKHV
jgi:hypothetical protein